MYGRPGRTYFKRVWRVRMCTAAGSIRNIVECDEKKHTSLDRRFLGFGFRRVIGV
jgi:hypothetical protein